jgi:hypothetical protein
MAIFCYPVESPKGAIANFKEKKDLKMANFAQYDVVTDVSVFLSASGTTIHDFPLDFTQNVNFGIRSVLSYMVDPGSASGVTFDMSVSNLLDTGSEQFKQIVGATTLPSMPPFLRQEVIDADTFARVNVSGLGVHKLRIRVTSGAANFSDIVHMYQFST